MIWFFIPGLSALLLIGFMTFRPTSQRRCPHCRQQDSIERVKRPALLKALFVWLPHRAYLCQACRRFFMLVG